MKVIITENYEEMSSRAFGILRAVVTENPHAVLGLATGSTPLGLYELMARDHRAGGVSYRDVKTVNLDEYVGLGANDAQSYARFMRENLFRFLDVDLKNTHIPNGKAEQREGECARYDALLRSLPRDLQILGIGSNGHIAFNEPGTPFSSTTHVVDLAESTIRDNSRLFSCEEEVPRSAFTMGLKSIMEAKHIVILASGENKSRAVRALVEGDVNESLPASILRTHPDCTLIADRAAASLLKEEAS